MKPKGSPAEDPEPGEVFSFASLRARIYAPLMPLIGGFAVIAVAISAPAPSWLLAIPTAIVLAAIVWRAVHVEIELRPEGVVLRNTYRTHKLSWGDVAHVYVGGGFNSPECIAFLPKDTRLGLEATGTGGAVHDRELVHQLRRYASPHGIELDPELEN